MQDLADMLLHCGLEQLWNYAGAGNCEYSDSTMLEK
jgi:hypothetical protein